jgi:hypothetical protein
MRESFSQGFHLGFPASSSLQALASIAIKFLGQHIRRNLTSTREVGGARKDLIDNPPIDNLLTISA